MHNIVIVGGNFAGVSTAHYLLRHVVPSLNSMSEKGAAAFKVTLVSPSDHIYFKISAPRILVSPDLLRDGKGFASIPEAFAGYDTALFTFVQGVATALDETTKVISVQMVGDNKPASVQYDSLVIATGTTSNSALWSLHGDHKESQKALASTNGSLSKMASVIVAGGGAAGVETVAEVASKFKPKDITILSGATRLLPRLSHRGVSAAAEKQLAALGVKTIHNVKVVSTSTTANGQTSVTLSDGSTKVVDVYLDVTGGAPNTNFLPKAWLDKNNRVATDGSTLRATQAPAGVYSAGDVASYSKMAFFDATFPIPALGYSIWSDLKASVGPGAKVSAPLKEKKYQQFTKDLQFVPVGPSGGVGVVFGWRIPSFLVWLVKSRTFFIENTLKVATGADFQKA